MTQKKYPHKDTLVTGTINASKLTASSINVGTFTFKASKKPLTEAQISAQKHQARGVQKLEALKENMPMLMKRSKSRARINELNNAAQRAKLVDDWQDDEYSGN